MKSSFTFLRGLVLALFMLVLVLMALFWFLYRGWGPLAEQAQQAEARSTRIVGLEDELRQKDDSLTAVQATGTAVAVERDTAIANHQLAEKDLIAQQEENDLLLTRVFTQAMMLESQPVITPSPPRVTIVEPAGGSVAQLGEPLTIVAAAADETGLAAVLMAHDGEVVTNTLAGETLQLVETEWLPAVEGDFAVAVTAVNQAQISSQVVSVTVQIQDLAAETAAFQQTVAAIIGAPAGSGADNGQQQVVEGNGRDLTANQLFLQAFDFPLPDGPADVSRLGEYCQLTAVPQPDNPLDSAQTRLAAIRALVRQQQLDMYDLAARETAVANQDARAALCAVAEGQIRLAQELYIAQASPELQADLQASLDEQLAIMPGTAPEIINEQQFFPVVEGLAFVRELAGSNGDFQAVDAAWQQMPVSTQQILHVAAYQEGKAPQFVALPALTAVLPPGWMLSDEGVLGEWLIGQYLSQGMEPATAVSTAAGWAGDRYAIYSAPGGEALALAWRAAWDSPEDAQVFASNYDVYLTSLLGAPGLEQVGNSNVRCWDGRAEAACFYPAEFQEQQETVVVRAPNKVTAQAVLDFILVDAALE